MTQKRNRGDIGLSIFNPPLLITESAHDFRALKAAFVAKVEPRDVVEQIFVIDFVHITWDILRFRRCKTALIEQAFFAALCDLIAECSDVRGEELRLMAESWFNDADARLRVLKMLADRKLDETAIEARAICSCIAHLEQLERMLTQLESRRDRALHHIFEYRRELALQLQHHSNDIIENVPQLRLRSSTAA